MDDHVDANTNRHKDNCNAVMPCTIAEYDASGNVSKLNDQGSLVWDAADIAAYTIELILAREALRNSPDALCTFPLEYDDYVYQHGVIVDRESRRTAGLRDVQQEYARWWQRSADTPLEELRKDGGRGDGRCPARVTNGADVLVGVPPITNF